MISIIHSPLFGSSAKLFADLDLEKFLYISAKSFFFLYRNFKVENI